MSLKRVNIEWSGPSAEADDGRPSPAAVHMVGDNDNCGGGESSSQFTPSGQVADDAVVSSGRVINPLDQPEPLISTVSQLPQSNPSVSVHASRMSLLVFVKVLAKILEDAGEARLKKNAKRTIRECTRKNRSGDPDFTPLSVILPPLLHEVVGEVYYNRANMLTRLYFKKSRRIDRVRRVAV